MLTRPIFGITDTLEQIVYMEAIRKAINENPDMPTAKLVEAFRDHHPDTLRGAPVAVAVDGELKMIRKGDLKNAGINVLDPESELAKKLQKQIEKKTNGDTDDRNKDKR